MSTFRKNRHGIAIAALAVLALPLAACSGTAAGENTGEPTGDAAGYDCSEPNSDSMTEITVAAMPIMTNMALYAGIDAGLFKKHGLAPTIEIVSASPATIAAVVGGSAQFGYSVASNFMQAFDQGQRIQGVAPFAGVEPGFVEKMEAGEPGYEKGVNALLTSEEISTPKDLEGKTVAVRDPIWSQMLVSEFLDANGVDVEQVEMVTLDPAAGYNALLAGQVDAAQSLEPFIAGWENEPVANLGWMELEVFGEGTNSLFFTSEEFAEQDPETVARFACAIAESSAFGNENHDKVRDAMAREQKVDRASIEDDLVPYFFTELTPADFDRVASLMYKWGSLTTELQFEDYFAAPAS